ncbi:TolC family protein [Desulfotalea psychrophila]|nr:TolC family protein [Desulfotalea psychrophila]
MSPLFFTKALVKKLYIIPLFCFIFPTLLSAAEQPGSAQPVSLQKVLENITKTNPSISEAMKQYQSVLAERGIANSEYYPTVGMEVAAGPERTKGVSTNDVAENLTSTKASLFARQNLYNGGKTTAFVKETDARIQAAAYEVLNVANNVYLNTSEAYINVIKARDLLAISGRNALTQERIMRQVREKTEAGFKRASELYNSESRLALAKGNYISRKQDLNQALVIFHKQFGRFLHTDQFITPEPTYQIPATLPETIEIAFNTHPALKVAKYNIQTKRYAYEKANAADFPTLDFEVKGQYRDEIDGKEGDTTQVGAYLTFNYTFFDGGLRSSEQSKQKQNVRKEYQRSYVERRNINESVRLAWSIKEADDYKKEYLSEHVTLSAKTLNAFKEEYYVGRRTLLDLLNMENEYTDAQLSFTESQFSHLIAIYRIMQATGALLSEHDTGLRGMLQIAADEKDDLFDAENRRAIEAYKDLNDNRDQDGLTDTKDQCDNSSPNSTVQPFGCSDNDANNTGYPYEDDSALSPYIVPQSFEPVSTKQQ